jgi:hypothetical protein
MRDIFISYAKEDRRWAQLFAQHLTNHGWSVFWDRTIPAGKTWREIVEKELIEARCVIVAWSKFSVNSDWVYAEADDARKRGALLPVFMESVSPPLIFRSIQAADLTNWRGNDQAVEFSRLLDDISALIGPPSIATRDPTLGAQATTPTKVIPTGQAAGKHKVSNIFMSGKFGPIAFGVFTVVVALVFITSLKFFPLVQQQSPTSNNIVAEVGANLSQPSLRKPNASVTRPELEVGSANYSGILAHHPARIVLLRHGEKAPTPAGAQDPEQLCAIGALRAQALSEYYLGKGAKNADEIFGEGKEPDAFFVITAHTQNTADPSVASWNGSKMYVRFSNDELGKETTRAAAELTSPWYDGKTIVIVWEPHHIADKQENGEDDTFWSLLRLGSITNEPVPKKWEGVNYDYIWIIDYTTSPPTFAPFLQKYGDPKYAGVPDNSWGAAVDAGKFPDFYRDCEHK